MKAGTDFGSGPFVQPPDPTSPPDVIALDLPCRGCGYSLRGLPGTGACPECGLPVSESLRGDLLRFADPGYVTRLARGARMVWWGIAVILLSLVGAVIAAAALAGRGGMWLIFLIPMAYLVSLVLSLVGWWLLTSPDPGERESDASRVSRKVLRAALMTSVICLVSNIVLHFGSVLVSGAGAAISARTFVDSLRALTVIVAMLAWVVQFFASMIHVRALAQRIPNATLARRTRVTFWAAIAIMGLLGVFMLVLATAAGSRATVLPACVVPLALVVLLLFYVSVVEMLKSSLAGVQRAIAADAAATAASPAGTTIDALRPQIPAD